MECVYADVNCDRMIDRMIYRDRIYMKYATEHNYEVLVCPKLTYSFATHSNVSTFPSPKEYILLGHSISSQIGMQQEREEDGAILSSTMEPKPMYCCRKIIQI